MRNFIVLAIAPLVLSACGPDLQAACENYITAANGCSEEAYPDDASTYALDAESTCAAYDGVTGAAAEESATILQCYADAYDAADCSTSDGYTAASTEMAACAG